MRRRERKILTLPNNSVKGVSKADVSSAPAQTPKPGAAVPTTNAPPANPAGVKPPPGGKRSHEGEPCKPGWTVARTGCVPKKKPTPRQPGTTTNGPTNNLPQAQSGGAGVTPAKKPVAPKAPKLPKAVKPPKPPKPPKPSVEGLHAAILGFQGHPERITEQTAPQLASLLTRMTVKDIHNLKRRLGLKASGLKAELANKVADRALKIRAESKPPEQNPEGPKQNPEQSQQGSEQGQQADTQEQSSRSGTNRQSGQTQGEAAQNVAQEGPKNNLPKTLEKPQQPTKGGPKTEQEWREHPTIKALGKRLNIKDIDHPVVQQHLEHLSRISPTLMGAVIGQEALRDGLFLGGGGVTDLDDNGHMKGVTPRGWPPGTSWDDCAGMYDSTNRKLCVGTAGSSSPSVALHEFGHAIGWALGEDFSPELKAHHKRLHSKLMPYLQQGGAGGLAGRQELMAEGFADVMMNRKTAVELYDEEFVSWMEGIINIKPEDVEP